jgi:putative DNA primase/helicase
MSAFDYFRNQPVWPDPQPLAPNSVSEPYSQPYPVEALPEKIGYAVQSVQFYLQAPMALVAASALSNVSLACQHLYDVSRDAALNSPISLYFLTIAASGERKSACDNLFGSEIRAYQDYHDVASKPAIEKFKALLDAWQAQYDGIRAEIKAKAKKGEPITTLSEQIQSHRQHKPIAPKVPHVIYTDVTPEQLAFSFVDRWPSGGILADEGGNFLGSHAMGKNSIVKNLALFNTLWDGKRLPVDRRGSECFVVDGGRLSVALMVQESPLHDLLNRSGDLARGSGFLARFLISWPESTQGTRPYKEPPQNAQDYQAFNQRMREILYAPFFLNAQGMLSPARLSLSPEGKRVWVEFHDLIEAELRDGGRFHHVRDCASKSADNVARMAALFHVFEGREGPIEADLVAKAATICWWHLNEALRFFGNLALPVELSDAAKLDAWLIRICNSANTCVLLKNHVRRNGPLRETKRLETALGELANLDRLRVGSYGRTTTIEVNPRLLSLRWD